MQLTETQITVAVEWWSKAIEHPKFDNGDTSQQGGIASMLAILAHGGTPVTSEKGKMFSEALRSSLMHGLDGYCLSVDYHPEGQLADAAEVAGISTDLVSWPWKTVMWFERDGVQVKQGYGAPVEVLLGE